MSEPIDNIIAILNENQRHIRSLLITVEANQTAISELGYEIRRLKEEVNAEN